MARSTEHAGALLLAVALVASGCVTGHLFDAGRRWEHAVGVEEASVDGGHVRLAYRVRITDDNGGPRGERTRRAAVSLDDVRAGLPVDRVRVESLPDGRPLAGTPVATTFARAGDGPPTIEIGPVEGEVVPPLYANVLTRHTTEPWVYPLVPAALAVDAVAVPVLLFFAPGAIVVGD